jgi:AcrR family transcriptional regulator
MSQCCSAKDPAASLRELLLREAERAIAEQGFFDVSARQVAVNVGVHPSTVVNLFGSRAALLKAAQARLSQRTD